MYPFLYLRFIASDYFGFGLPVLAFLTFSTISGGIFLPV
nr:MAG TPA: hypothetical protein [Bacteriophage sp.]